MTLHILDVRLEHAANVHQEHALDCRKNFVVRSVRKSSSVLSVVWSVRENLVVLDMRKNCSVRLFGLP